jgi:hypothetical protein
MIENLSRPDAAGTLPATLTFTTLVDQSQRRSVPGFVSRAGLVAGDMLAGVAVVLCIPFIILAVAIPIALTLRLLLWIVGLL